MRMRLEPVMFSVTHARRQRSTQLSHELSQKKTFIESVYVFVFSQVLSSQNCFQPKIQSCAKLINLISTEPKMNLYQSKPFFNLAEKLRAGKPISFT